MTDRDPLIDPRYGDVVVSRQFDPPRYRHVTARNGDNVSYRLKIGGPIKVCRITTWVDWCEANEARVQMHGMNRKARATTREI